MHHDHATLGTTSLHCICILICRVIVIWTYLCVGAICYSWDLLVVTFGVYLSSFEGSVAGTRGELGWTCCAHLRILVDYIEYTVERYIYTCILCILRIAGLFWVQVVVLGDGWCGRSICVLYSLPVFSIFLRVPIDFGTHPCFYTII